MLQARWHVNFLFWYPTDALLDLLPGNGHTRLGSLVPLALLATALVSCAAAGLQRTVDAQRAAERGARFAEDGASPLTPEGSTAQLQPQQRADGPVDAPMPARAIGSVN